jgi:hypothetical protein
MKSIKSASVFGLGKLGSGIAATSDCPELASLGRRIAAISALAYLFNTAAGNGRPSRPCDGPVGKPTDLLALEWEYLGTSRRLTSVCPSSRIT